MKKIYLLTLCLCAFTIHLIQAQTVIVQTADSSMILPASESVPGPGMVPSTYDDQINGWSAGSASWQIKIIKPSNITIYANYTSDYDNVGLTVNVSNGTSFNKVTLGTGDWGTFLDVMVGQISLNPGNYTFSLGVNMSAMNFRHVRLTRQIVPLTLTTAVNNPSFGSIARTPYKATYEISDTISLKAIPYPGYKFNNWSGALTSSKAIDTLVISGNQTVTANFIPGGAVFPDGMDKIILPAAIATLDNSGIVYNDSVISSWDTGSAYWDIEVPCPATYIIEGEISGPATPATGSLNILLDSIPVLGYYSTSGAGYNSYAYQGLCGITLEAGTYKVKVSRVLTGANNAINLKTLRLVKGTSDRFALQLSSEDIQTGTVESSPFKALYEAGDTVIIKAKPVAGYRFVSWSGDYTSTKETDTIVVNSNMVIMAHFELPTGMVNPSGEKLQIYPNPFTQSITISNSESLGITKIELLNLTGAVVWTAPKQSFQNNPILLEDGKIENLTPGIYLLHIVTNESSMSYKIVKKLE